MTEPSQKKRLEQLEARLMRQLFLLASLYAAPALLVAAIIPTLDTTALISDIHLDWSKLRGGGVVFSLVGFIALGGALVNSSFSYAANSQNPAVVTHLRKAAKSLYASLVTILSLVGVAFALNFYTFLLQTAKDTSLNLNFGDIVLIAGLLLMGTCTLLAAIKFQRFISNVMQVMRLEADEP